MYWTELTNNRETHFNLLDSKGSYSATSNNTKVVHWPLMGGLDRYRWLGNESTTFLSDPADTRIPINLEIRIRMLDHFYRAMLCIARTMPSQGVCLFVPPYVRMSVTRRYSVETAKHIFKLFSTSGSITILHCVSKTCAHVFDDKLN